MRDEIVLLARSLAEIASAILTLVVWLSTGDAFNWGVLVGVLIFWVVVRNILVSVAAWLCH